jgi:hypothetical protein
LYSAQVALRELCRHASRNGRHIRRAALFCHFNDIKRYANCQDTLKQFMIRMTVSPFASGRQISRSTTKFVDVAVISRFLGHLAAGVGAAHAGPGRQALAP